MPLLQEQKYLKVLQKVTKLTSMVLDHQQVMDTIVCSLPDLMAVDAATIRLLDSETGQFVMGAAHGLSVEYLSRFRIDTEETIEMIRSGYPVARTDMDQKADYHDQELVQGEGVKSVLTLPIIFQDSIIGMLRLLTREKRIFTADEISFSMALGEQVGMAISNSRMFNEMDNQVNFMKEIQEISTLVNSSLDLSAILDTIAERLPRSLGCKGCTIRLVQTQTNQLDLVASHGLSETYLQRGHVENEKNVEAALSGSPVSIYNVSQDDRISYKKHMEREGIKSLLSVPIKARSEVIGVLRILSEKSHCFTSSEINFAVTAAEVGGLAIRNAKTYQQISLLCNQIEENEHFLTNILDCIRPKLLVVDRDKRLVLVNKVLQEEMGHFETELLGSSYDTLWQNQDCDIMECPISRVLRTEKSTAFTHKTIQNDKVNWCERTASPIRGPDGKIEYVIEVIRDITAQKQLEEEQLERVKLQGVVELAGTVAHEINSPLFAALGTAQFLEEDLKEQELIDDMGTIIRNLKEIRVLTGKMTSMTGFESRDYVGDTKIVKIK
ncbi:GAF domain-containing protein [Desulforhopalus vacuolatus]|uniref:GAF domain-containing protein n=1 Tax=Desulforhopalus vacuolatus TaxID=40414 RepID=UPI001966C30C|nr:GAF domain-containing protein [Desulforhopalus vacuolatus]MBM9518935.1 GAF domain-containing protein [Desulforhopalus vacuolatus]